MGVVLKNCEHSPPAGAPCLLRRLLFVDLCWSRCDAVMPADEAEPVVKVVRRGCCFFCLLASPLVQTVCGCAHRTDMPVDSVNQDVCSFEHVETTRALHLFAKEHIQ